MSIWGKGASIPILGVTGEKWSGKAQPLDCKVATPSGWKRMGDIVVGDSVLNPEGGVAKVIGVFPQGVKPVVRVTFSDGAQTQCCREHLWLSQTHMDHYRNRSGRVVETTEIEKAIKANRSRYIPTTQPLEFEENACLEIDPYLLGSLLGDGCFVSSSVAISSDQRVIENVTAAVSGMGCELQPKPNSQGKSNEYYITGGPRAKGHKNRLIQFLEKSGLRGKGSHEKFIPENYKLSSIESRVALLKGLIVDTDGHVQANGSIDFVTTSSQMMSDVVDVVRSLGGVCSPVTSRIPKYTYLGS
jgi:ATP-dependent DNA helicase RecG